MANGERVAPEGSDRDTLSRLVARYLARSVREDGQPLDPVARFHLGNGASLDRVLPNADRFAKRLQASAGTMVSYLYDLDSIESNHERYADGHDAVCDPAAASIERHSMPARSPATA